jgi:serine/threonine-protein kinase
MGAVWVASHTELEVDVAIKFMVEALAASEQGRARFKREARAAARLKSPHVTHIYDYGVENGAPYMVMELLEGEDLGQRLARLGKLDFSATMAIVDGVARGLKLAHDAGIVHRDLKPTNVFLARSGDHEVVKILDFGIAKEATLDGSTEATASGALVGSPRYMSPEQAQGEKTDPRSDLWSLSVLVYQMLTGRQPFLGDSLGKLILAICTETPTPATTVAPTLPPETDDFFRRGLARQLDERFGTVTELVAALRALDPGAAVDALPRASAPRSSGPQVVGRDEDTSDLSALGDRTRVLVGAPEHPASAATTPHPTPPDLTSTTGPALARRDDATSPGVGLESRRSGIRRRRFWVLAVASLGVVIFVAQLALRLGEGDAETAAPSNASSTTPADPVPRDDRRAAPAPSGPASDKPPPVASSTPPPASVPARAAQRPPPRAAPPSPSVSDPAPTPRPRFDPFSGLPVP